MNFRYRLLGALGAAAIAALPTLANGQSWPQRSVHLILPLGPASGADITSRILGERLQKKWGQSVIIENRPGGDAIVAITAVLNTNDDHTLLFGPSAAFVAHPYTRAKVPYNVKDIIPIVRATVTLVSVSVPTAIGVNSLAELIDLARKQPGKLNWAAVTGLNDFQFNSFVKTAGVTMVRVPYRDAIQAVNDLAENRIQAYSSAFATARPIMQTGKIKVIALTNTQPAKILPGVPTARQAGFPALEFDGLVGAYGTKAVSQEARSKIEKDVIEILRDPAISDRLTATGQVVLPGTAAEFNASIDGQRAIAAQTAKVLGIKAAGQQ
jgi:tripartite-type tricarboxylate transporter receptor subunit TctC